MKTKNPKKVEAGRKAAMARAKKLDELKKLAAANQQRVHTEIVKDSPPGGGEVTTPEEPHKAPSQPDHSTVRQWNIQTGWLIGGGALLLVGYIIYIKKSEKKSSPNAPAPGVPPPVAPLLTAKVPVTPSATASQPERQSKTYVPYMN
jgi:hypothetical protein